MTKRPKLAELVSERLWRALTGEVDALEASAPPEGEAPGKARLDAIGTLARVLEKLLELRRLEALARRDGEDGEGGEGARLRDELVRRLRLLDERRARGERLLTQSGPPYAGRSA